MYVPRGLDILRKKGKSSIPDLPIDSVSLSLQDLIGYFQPPGDYLEHEDKQNLLRALKNRQNLFQEEVTRRVNIWFNLKKTDSKGFFMDSITIWKKIETTLTNVS